MPDRSERVVAVVIPVRDGESTIADAIRSALASDVVGEVVVVDDGSADESAHVAGAVADGRVTVVRQPPAGVCTARNLGAGRASARWLVFLDADDQLAAEGVERLVDGLGPGTTLACGLTENRRPDGTTAVADPPKRIGPIVSPMLAGSFAVRRTAFQQVGGYDERLAFAENTDLSIRLLHDPGAAAEIRPILVLRRQLVSPGRRAARYSERIVASAEHFLDVHDAVLAEAELTATYASVGAVAAARLRRWGVARRLLRRSLRSPGRRWTDAGRLVVTYLPAVRERLWRA